MAKVCTNISLDATLKKESVELFRDLGLDLSTAITVFLKQAVRKQGLPFTVERDIPNEETRVALTEYEEMKKNPSAYKRYSSFSEAMSDVLQNS